MSDQGQPQLKHSLEKAGRYNPPVTVDIPKKAFEGGSLQMPKMPDVVFSHLGVDMDTWKDVAALNRWLKRDRSHFMPDATMAVSDMPKAGILRLLSTFYGPESTPPITDTVPAVFQVIEPTAKTKDDLLYWSSHNAKFSIDSKGRWPYYMVMDAPRPDESVGEVLKCHSVIGQWRCYRTTVTEATDARLQPDMVFLFGGDLTSRYCHPKNIRDRCQAMDTMATMVADVALAPFCVDSPEGNDIYVAIKPDVGSSAGSTGGSVALTEEQERNCCPLCQPRSRTFCRPERLQRRSDRGSLRSRGNSSTLPWRP